MRKEVKWQVDEIRGKSILLFWPLENALQVLFLVFDLELDNDYVVMVGVDRYIWEELVECSKSSTHLIYDHSNSISCITSNLTL